MMSVNPDWMIEIGDLEEVVGTKVEGCHMGMMVDFNEERMTGLVKAVESPVEAWRDMDPCAADRWGEKVIFVGLGWWMPEHYGEVQNVMGKEISRPVGQVKNMVVEEINKTAVQENETGKVIDKLDSLVKGKESGRSRGRVMGEGYDRYHRQDRVGRGREQREVEDGWDAAVRRSGILGGGQEQAGAAGSSGEEARRWTWGGRGLDLDWAWNDELKVWIPEKAQRPNDEEELIGEMDLFEDMERNYGRACKKLVAPLRRDQGAERRGQKGAGEGSVLEGTV